MPYGTVSRCSSYGLGDKTREDFIDITKNDLNGGSDQKVKYDFGESCENYLRLMQSVCILKLVVVSYRERDFY